MSGRFQKIDRVACLITLIVFSWSSASWAEKVQEDLEEASDEETDLTYTLEAEPEKLPVTGARLKQVTSYINSPLQVISKSFNRETGLVDAAEVFQKATQSSKPRIVVVFVGSVSPLRTERSTFNSTAPVQVIDAKLERSLGNVGLRNVFQEPD